MSLFKRLTLPNALYKHGMAAVVCGLGLSTASVTALAVEHHEDYDSGGV